ncbi:MAG: hypothetical protein QOK18_133 [Mycobacterium sp.]|jgi:hypothetical protein|nr:hypothetical protein [Mycobacterium sp.]MDT7759557.1 hypothetical protein [Mycobacterium sp.]
MVLGGLALQGWVLLVPAVIRNGLRVRWIGLRDQAHGGWELASVATSGETGWPGLSTVSLVIFWIAFVLWLLTALAAPVATESLAGFRRSRGRGAP